MSSRSDRRKRIRLFAVVFYTFIIMAVTIPFYQAFKLAKPFGSPFGFEGVGSKYLKNEYDTTSKTRSGSANTVTSIVVYYRGFDTLGEITVLFLAVAGAIAMLYRRNSLKNSQKNSDSKTEPNGVLKIGAKFLFPFLVLTGAYVFIHGHLTPGGGFPGGVIVATAYLLLLMSYPEYKIKHKPLSMTESLAGLSFAIIGLIGLFFFNSFLKNFLPPGNFNTLLSGGIIPIIYVAVGFKVGSELAALVDGMLEA